MTGDQIAGIIFLFLAWTVLAVYLTSLIAYNRGWNKGFDQAASTIREAIAGNTAQAWEKRNLGRGKDV